jgi:hypothetical protein
MELFDRKLTAAAYPHKQFVFFRVFLGTYLVVHFCMLAPYCAELFSNTGVLADASLNLTFNYFPDVLFEFDRPAFVKTFLFILIVLSVVFITGFQGRVVSFLLWYGWASLINRNNFIINPGMPYIGWLLLACAFIPEHKGGKWQMPGWAITGAWLILAVGYTVSGIDKLFSISWARGSSLELLLSNPLARDNFITSYLALLPAQFLKIATWTILIAEISFLPLALFEGTRKYAWLLMTVIHLGILCILDFADLTAGMLMIHVFTYDLKWFTVGNFQKLVSKHSSPLNYEDR